MLDQDNNFHLISLSILITCLLDNVWILLRYHYTFITSESQRVKDGHIKKNCTYMISTWRNDIFNHHFPRWSCSITTVFTHKLNHCISSLVICYCSGSKKVQKYSVFFTDFYSFFFHNCTLFVRLGIIQWSFDPTSLWWLVSNFSIQYHLWITDWRQANKENNP